MYRIAFFIAVPFIALLFEGIFRKTVARIHNRVGPPIWQPFYDFVKLLKKTTLKTRNDVFFMTAPFFYFAVTYSLFIFVPFPFFGFAYDFIFIVYLTILASAFYVLAGASSDSPYGIVGSMREMILMLVYEMAFAIVIFNFMINAGVISFSAFQSNFMILNLPISAFCLLAAAMVELKITPFDTPEAGPEILTGADVEYSAKNLAFFELAKYMKKIFFAFIAAMLFVGTQNLLWFFLVFLIVYFIFIFSQATTCRFRVDQARKVYVIVLALALVDFILISRGII